MEDYEQKIKDIFQTLSKEEYQILLQVIRLEQNNRQTLHEKLDDSLIKEIVKIVEKDIK